MFWIYSGFEGVASQMLATNFGKEGTASEKF